MLRIIRTNTYRVLQEAAARDGQLDDKVETLEQQIADLTARDGEFIPRDASPGEIAAAFTKVIEEGLPQLDEPSRTALSEDEQALLPVPDAPKPPLKTALGAVDSIDDVPGDEFWEIVEQHQVPDPPGESSEDRFRAEVAQALAEERPLGEPAVWRRGGVTMAITGASRVNSNWPQVTAELDINSVTGETKSLRGDHVTWHSLWEAVSQLLDSWRDAVAEHREAYETAHAAAERAKERAQKAAGAAAGAEKALNALLPQDDRISSTMSKDEVADYLDIAPGSVRKQMSRWSIEPAYERGPSGRTEARYPTAAVQAAASRRPGRGHRTDLD